MAAGKISGPGGTPPSDVPGADQASNAGQVDKAGKAEGAAFADKLREATAPRGTTGAGAAAPAAVRDRVRAALESAVADDPVLSEKIKALGSI